MNYRYALVVFKEYHYYYRYKGSNKTNLAGFAQQAKTLKDVLETCSDYAQKNYEDKSNVCTNEQVLIIDSPIALDNAYKIKLVLDKLMSQNYVFSSELSLDKYTLTLESTNINLSKLLVDLYYDHSINKPQASESLLFVVSLINHEEEKALYSMLKRFEFRTKNYPVHNLCDLFEPYTIVTLFYNA